MSKRKETFYLLVISILIAACGQLYYSYHYKPVQERKVEVYYNKEHALHKEIIKTIQDADQYVYFAIYTFTRQDIKDALLAAKYRNLTVIGITDVDQYNRIEEQKKIIDQLREKGISVYEENHGGIMHLKTLVTEKAYISGSYNWTASATNSNDEVLEVGRGEQLREKYKKVLETIFAKYRT